jgi:glucose-6-phosphate isomerase
MLRLDYASAESHLVGTSPASVRDKTFAAHAAVVNGTGAGSDYLGWRSLLANPNDALLEDITSTAARIRGTPMCSCASESAARTSEPRLSSRHSLRTSAERAGDHLRRSSHEWSLCRAVARAPRTASRCIVNVISKSGTTLEPALGFRFLRKYLEETSRMPTSASSSPPIPRPVRSTCCGRRSDTRSTSSHRMLVAVSQCLRPSDCFRSLWRDRHPSLFYGAVAAKRLYDREVDNAALDYAAMRYLHHQAGMTVETLAVFEPSSVLHRRMVATALRRE